MTNFDDYFTDETVRNRSYKEFTIDPIDNQNLIELEKNIIENKINKSNKKDMLEYLEKLYKKISEIKKNEMAYEGENNLNVNEYLERIKSLIIKISRI